MPNPPTTRAVLTSPHTHRRDRLGHVVAVGAGERGRQRDAFGFDHERVLAAAFASIRGIRPGVSPPSGALSFAASIAARDQSSAPAPASLAGGVSCNACQTPAARHSPSRRQQAIPLPLLMPAGRASQGMPVFGTNTIPDRQARPCRPGQASPVRHPRPSASEAAFPRRQQRLDRVPQLVRHQRLGQRSPSLPDSRSAAELAQPSPHPSRRQPVSLGCPKCLPASGRLL